MQTAQTVGDDRAECDHVVGVCGSASLLALFILASPRCVPDQRLAFGPHHALRLFGDVLADGAPASFREEVVDNDEVVEAADDGRDIKLPHVARVNLEPFLFELEQIRDDAVNVRTLRGLQNVLRIIRASCILEAVAPMPETQLYLRSHR